MTRTFYRILGGSLLVALIFVGLGCRKPTPKPVAPKPPAPAVQQQVQPPVVPVEPAPPAEEEEAAPPAEEEPADLTDCSHPYYPLKDGNQINYQVTAGGKKFEYVLTVSDVTDNSARLNIAITDPQPMTIVQDIQCSGGTIRTNGYMDLGAAMTGGQMKTETKNVTGDLMPKELSAGTTWTTKYDTIISMKGADLPVSLSQMTGTVESVNLVQSEETVVVPAGTYKALKVKVDTTTTVTIPGVPTGPSTTKQTNYQWWVKGVGMIKSSDAAGLAPMEATRVIMY